MEEPAPYFGNAGDKIRYIRKKKGVTIVELAKRMGVSQAYIVRLERGEARPTAEQIELIQAFLNNEL